MNYLNTNCIICNNTSKHKIIWGLIDNRNVIECQYCKHKSVFPRPSNTEIVGINTGMYKDNVFKMEVKKENWAKASIRVYNEYIRKYSEKKEKYKLLDIGGGLGYYSKAFKEIGFDVTTVEMDLISSEFAEKKLGLNKVFKGSLEEFDITSSTLFDIIFCRHLIEHFENPEALIKKCRKLLCPGGLLIIETDNNQSIELLLNYDSRNFYIRLYKKILHEYNFLRLLLNPIFAIDPPRHIHSFKSRNLQKLIRNNGLNVEKTLSYSFGSKLWPNIPNTKIKHLSIRKLGNIKKDLYNILFSPLRFVLNIFGLGAGILIIAKNN